MAQVQESHQVTDMIAQLVLHEGLRLQEYIDTEDNVTIGVGYNVTARGWNDWARITGKLAGDGMTTTRADALAVLAADLVRVEAAVRVHFPEYGALDVVRQRVVLDMAFNIGFRALGFKQTIAAIHARDWSRASREMYKSKWARQVGQRCDRLARMLLTGLPPTDVPAI